MAHYSSFVIQIWVDEGKLVRGEISHIQTQERVRFLDLEKMQGFMMNHLIPAREDLAGHDQESNTFETIQHGHTQKTQALE